MAKILCGISGIEYTCEHFPVYLTRRETYHPVFSIPPKKLWKYLPKWQAGELTTTDSYLLFLAFLNATDKIHWDFPCKRTENTDSIVAQNMESLAAAVSEIFSLPEAAQELFPQYVVTGETATLGNVKLLIQGWHSAYEDFKNGLREERLSSDLRKKEIVLEKLIKSVHIPPEKYAHILGEWAEIAGNFPQFPIAHPIQKINVPISVYWKELIQKCYNMVSLIQYPAADLKELLDHCEENIDVGSIYSYQLFSTLRDGMGRINDFFGIGDLGLSATNPGFQIISETGNAQHAVEKANLDILKATAPTSEPRRIDYPSELAYIRAKMKWSLVSQSTESPIQNEIEGESEESK